jgi:putative transposase
MVIVMDLFNREIIGWSVSKIISTELIKRALGNACTRADDKRDILFHSDRECAVQQQRVQSNAAEA